MKPTKAPLGLFAATRAIAQGKLSPQDYLQQCVARADEREPSLHAFVARTPTDNLLQTVSDGEWAGIPVGVKDLIATRELATTNGSRSSRRFVSWAQPFLAKRSRQSLPGANLAQPLTRSIPHTPREVPRAARRRR